MLQMTCFRRCRQVLSGVAALAAFGGLTGAASGAPLAPLFGLPAEEITVPADAVASNEATSLDGLACVSVGNCVAVGTYSYSASYATHAMVATEIDGVWGAAVGLQYPGSSTDGGAGLRGVACSSVGDCVAVGNEGMIVTETGGTWGQPIQVQLPSDGVSPGQAQLNSIECTSVGNCVAVGSFVAADGYDHPMMVSEVNGIWGQATRVPPPANAGVPAAGQLNSVACSSYGNCAAVGQYLDSSTYGWAMVTTEINGTWGEAAEVELPANAEPIPEGQATSVSCPSDGVCVAVGNYLSTVSGLRTWSAIETGPTWGQAQPIYAPSVSASIWSLTSVVCSDTADCVAGGNYQTAAGYRPMTVTETSGAWDEWTSMNLPMNAMDGYFPTVTALSCPGNGLCESAGYYIDTNDDAQPIVSSSVSRLTLSTSYTGYGQATVGTPFSAQVFAAGGTGNHSLSISVGSLPPGLSLDGATGVISGTPTTIGSWSFTIGASDPGPPVQTSSRESWINVNPAAVNRAATTTTRTRSAPTATATPNTVITKASINSRSHTATFRFKSTGRATGFRCAIQRRRSNKHTKVLKPKYGPCRSPKSYNHLRPGVYIFHTAAYQQGQTDRTPAAREFEIG